METIPNARDHLKSCFDRRANLILSVLISLIVIVGGVNIIALMMERGISGGSNRDRTLTHLEQCAEKNVELTARYDDLVKKHSEIVRENIDMTRRYSELLGRYETFIGQAIAEEGKSNGAAGHKP